MASVPVFGGLGGISMGWAAAYRFIEPWRLKSKS
jgi:hypothetical protein